MVAGRILRSLIVAAALAAAVFAASAPANARDTSVFSKNPYPCTVLSPFPCHPTFCSVFSHHPCQPDINYPFGQDLRLTIASRATAKQPAKPDASPDPNASDKDERHLNTIRDLFAALRACWTPPAKDDAREGTQMSVRLSFKRDGDLVGAPRVTYVSAGTSPEVRQTYLDAITHSLKACTPLPLSRGLGGAIAGRPIAIRFIDDRPQ